MQSGKYQPFFCARDASRGCEERGAGGALLERNDYIFTPMFYQVEKKRVERDPQDAASPLVPRNMRDDSSPAHPVHPPPASRTGTLMF